MRGDSTALQSLVLAGLIKQTAEILHRLFRGQPWGHTEKEVFGSAGFRLDEKIMRLFCLLLLCFSLLVSTIVPDSLRKALNSNVQFIQTIVNNLF